MIDISLVTFVAALASFGVFSGYHFTFGIARNPQSTI